MSRFGRAWRVLLFPFLLGVGLGFGRGAEGVSEFLPKCVIHEATGWHCPGCGGTRAFQALARADALTALRMNPLGMGVIVFMALLALRTSWEAVFPKWRWRRLPFSDRAAWTLVVGVLLFAVLRNLPFWPFTFLAPS